MNWYWVWTAWVLALITSFSILEGLALAWGGLTLSRFTAELSKDWPLLPWVLGVLVGGLAVHFWWYWKP